MFTWVSFILLDKYKNLLQCVKKLWMHLKMKWRKTNSDRDTLFPAFKNFKGHRILNLITRFVTRRRCWAGKSCINMLRRCLQKLNNDIFNYPAFETIQWCILRTQFGETSINITAGMLWHEADTYCFSSEIIYSFWDALRLSNTPKLTHTTRRKMSEGVKAGKQVSQSMVLPVCL